MTKLTDHIFRFFGKDSFSDFTLAITDEVTQEIITTLKLHRLILAQCGYFESILYGKWSTQSKMTIKLAGACVITKSIINLFFKLLYSDDYSEIGKLTCIQCFYVYLLSEFFSFDPIKNYSINYAIEKIPQESDFDNVYFSCMQLECDVMLKNACSQWMLLREISRNNVLQAFQLNVKFNEHGGVVSSVGGGQFSIEEAHLYLKSCIVNNRIFLTVESDEFGAVRKFDLFVSIITKSATNFYQSHVTTSMNGSKVNVLEICGYLINDGFRMNEMEYLLGISFDVKVTGVNYSISRQPHEK